MMLPYRIEDLVIAYLCGIASVLTFILYSSSLFELHKSWVATSLMLTGATAYIAPFIVRTIRQRPFKTSEILFPDEQIMEIVGNVRGPNGKEYKLFITTKRILASSKKALISIPLDKVDFFTFEKRGHLLLKNVARIHTSAGVVQFEGDHLVLSKMAKLLKRNDRIIS